MNKLKSYLGKSIEIKVSGGKTVVGTLADLGSDLLVMSVNERFMYIPFVHVQSIEEVTAKMDDGGGSALANQIPSPVQIDADQISYRNLLLHVRGQFVELYVSGRDSIHGYLTSVMNNYFVFYSPIYKSVYISLEHLKWLIPYPTNMTPYSLNQSLLPVNPTTLPLSRGFDEQVKKLAGHLVVFDFGDKEEKVGLLRSVDNNLAELVTASGDVCHWNLRHLKSVHLP
ncbi:DUF2642 domain-containing protein [Tumebacillus sp. ITR2]|uniref:DUF2642 domain-containing protein n=1 Tax=Tumebacillus amylolyticus TaxID=2801339 RepID=A0ABS1JE51_9BACL|nr:DUF2642 domain-containing protein [Tumebacillus amylolyticus]MBL0388264.1 DUF2642 domain-containing protein [Tumebacillus amylolyticus]